MILSTLKTSFSYSFLFDKATLKRYCGCRCVYWASCLYIWCMFFKWMPHCLCLLSLCFQFLKAWQLYSHKPDFFQFQFHCSCKAHSGLPYMLLLLLLDVFGTHKETTLSITALNVLYTCIFGSPNCWTIYVCMYVGTYVMYVWIENLEFLRDMKSSIFKSDTRVL